MILMSDSRKIIVIGSGPAAYTAAIYSARADLNPLIIGGMATGGQLMLTSEVENYPGFPEPVLGPELMERMKKQCERLGVSMINEDVSKINLSSRPFQLETTEGKAFTSETVIIATGATAQWLGIESEKKLMGHGVSACATCDGFFFKGKEVVVVGGGDTALEEALFLSKFASKVTVIHRRDQLRASRIMQDRAFKNPKLSFVWDSMVSEVLGNGHVSGVRVKNLKTEKLSDIACHGFFVAIGHKPTVAFLGGQLKLDDHGYIVTDGRTRTSIPGVFAAGDVMDSRYRQAVTAAGTGCMAALEAERFLAGEK